jgi:acetyl-CoA acetyltransferase
MSDVFVLSGKRTAIGDYGKTLKDIAPTKLGEIAIRAALAAGGVEAAEIQQVVMGNVIHTEPRDCYLSRVCAIDAGIPVEAPALTVNRLCGSGLQAIVSAAQSILLGDADLAVAGGDEPGRLSVAERTLGRQAGRCQGDRHGGGHAERSIRRRPHGYHRGERGGAL